MQGAPRPFPAREADPGTGFLLASVALVLVGGLLYSRYEKEMADGILALARILLHPLAALDAGYAKALANLANLEPGTRDPSFAMAVLGRVCRPYVLVCLPLLLLLALRGWRLGVSDVYKRSLGMKELVAANRTLAPCIAPILNWPHSILAEPLDSGPWMAARQPLQLAADKNLLVLPAHVPGHGGRNTPVPREEILGPDNLALSSSRWLGKAMDGLALDRERAQAVFASQLGPAWEGVYHLPGYLYKFAAALALFACEEKDAAKSLLDSLSLSFRAPQRARPAHFDTVAPFWHPARRERPYAIDASIAKDILAKVQRALASDVVQEAMRPHLVYRNLALLALYEAARRKGVLPTAEFIWLRPLNRPLYYLLNNVGRRTAWPEIAGAWAHYEAEKVLAGMDPESLGIADPQVTEAINALEVALYEEGWISPDRLSDSVARNKKMLGLD